MFFDLTMVYALTLCSLTTAAALKQKRASVNGTIIYAYGDGTNGARVFYADGLAYIGDTAPGWTGTTSNVTFTTDSTDSTVPWTISSNSTPTAFNSTPSMYIVPTSGAFDQVGFVSSNGSVPVGGVTTGFTWFGTSVAYSADSSDYGLQFWANATNVTGIWALHWNSDGNSDSGAFPVVLKSTAPTVLTAAALMV